MNRQMRDFFDNLAPEWLDVPEEHGVRERLVEMMKLPEGMTILDIGCGKGVMEEHLLKCSPQKIIAVDLSEKMIASARQRYNDPRISFLCGDLFDLDLPRADVAVFFNAYPHFIDKFALSKRIAALLRPGGVFIICHSRSRDMINGRHDNKTHTPPLFRLSVPLRNAELEAEAFTDNFVLDCCEDTEQLFFIRLIRY